jgi:hypothetical protein
MPTLNLAMTGMGVTSPVQSWVLIEAGYSYSNNPLQQNIMESALAGSIDAPCFYPTGSSLGVCGSRYAQRNLVAGGITYREASPC